MIGIQNSSKQIKINFFARETIDLPTSFIIGMSFIFLVLPASVILFFTEFPFKTFTSNPLIIESIIYIIVLAFFGTAIAKVLYIKLLAISSPVFSVSTTYLIPIVAIFWGLLDGEEFKLIQF